MAISNSFNQKSVAEFILETLRVRPDQRASEIWKGYLQIGPQVTLQAIYKELARHMGAGKVTKQNKSYRLHLGYVFRLLSEADALSDRYCRTPLGPLQFSTKRQRYVFQNLLRLNDFWTNISLSLVQHSRSKQYFSWNPQCWCWLLQPKQEQDFYFGLRRSGVEAFKIIGDENFLNMLASKQFDAKRIQSAFRVSRFHSNMSQYLTVVDDFVVTVELSAKLTNILQEVFRELNSERRLRDFDILALSRMNGRATMTIEQSPKLAHKYRREFLEYFL